MGSGITIEQIVIFITVCGVLYGIFHNKSSATKAQFDQFHKRDNDALHAHYANVERIAKIEGFNEGVKVGRAQIVQELNLPSKKDDS